MDVREKFLRKFGGPVRYSDRQLQLFALLTAVAVNLVFWGVLFKYRVPDAAVRSSSASVELLRLDGSSGSGNLTRWLEYHDPAKIGDSGYRGGFTAQLPPRELNFDLPVERPRHTVGPTTTAERGFRPLVLSEKPSVSGIPLPDHFAHPPAGAPLKVPTAVDDRGRNIRIAVGAAPMSTERVTDDSVLLVTVPKNGEPNFVLWRSCGDPRLDGLAAGMVSAAVRELDPPPSHVIIRWPAAGAGGKAAK